MDFNKLEKANELREEIKELDGFIDHASKVWEGTLSIKGMMMRFVTKSYGIYSPKEFNMNTHIKNRVLRVLEDYKRELEEEFKNI